MSEQPVPEQPARTWRFERAAGFIRRRWPIMVATVSLAVVGSLVYSTTTEPTYRSSSEVLLRTEATDLLFPAVSEEALRVIRNPTAELEATRADAFVTVAAADVSPDITVRTSLSSVDDGDRSKLVFTAEAASAQRGAEAANQWADVYLAQRHELDVANHALELAEVTASLAEIDAELEVVLAPLRTLDDEVAAATPDALPGVVERRNVVAASVSPQQSALEAERAKLAVRVAALQQVGTAVADPGMAAKLSVRAAPSSRPSRPNPIRDGLAAAVGGLLLGLLVAVRFDRWRGRTGPEVKPPVASLTAPIPEPLLTLATIPRLTRWHADEEPVTVVWQDPQSPEAEAYRRLRTSVLFLAEQRQLSVFQITSASEGEGKSTTIANLAAALSEAGHAVGIVDADLRRPSLHRYFRVRNERGLIDVLSGAATVNDVLWLHPKTRLAILPAGQVSANPFELIGSPLFGEVIAELERIVDIVLIDSPPLGPVDDGRVITQWADAVMVVASTDSFANGGVDFLQQALAVVDAPVIGAIAHDLSARAGTEQYYRYGVEAAPVSEM